MQSTTAVVMMIWDSSSTLHVPLQDLQDTNNASATGRAFSVSGGAKLGLFNLVLDGQNRAPGVLVEGTLSALQADAVTFQRLFGTSDGAAAVAAFNGAQVSMNDSELLDNTCDTCFGGALVLINSDAKLQDVGLLRNTASNGGAVDTFGTSTLTLKGRSIVLHNTATVQDGAFFIELASRVLIKGRLCASGNRARFEGGFARVAGQLVFDASSEVLLSDHIPDTIRLFGAVQCGVDSPSWNSDNVFGKDYSITGPACACNTSFVAGDNTTCVSAFPDCGCSTCDQDTCGCCTDGDCCLNGLFAQNGTVCRASTGPANPAESCDGESATCPDDVNNTQCAPADGDCCDEDTGRFAPSGTVCRASTGPGDDADSCTGDRATCPDDDFDNPDPTECTEGDCCQGGLFAPSGTVCRRPQGPCERVSTCSGDTPTCRKEVPVNGKPCLYEPFDNMFWSRMAKTAAPDSNNAP